MLQFVLYIFCVVESMFPHNWNKIGTKVEHTVHFLSTFETLSKPINIVRYVFKFSFMISLGIRWKVSEGFVDLQLYL